LEDLGGIALVPMVVEAKSSILYCHPSMS